MYIAENFGSIRVLDGGGGVCHSRLLARSSEMLAQNYLLAKNNKKCDRSSPCLVLRCTFCYSSCSNFRKSAWF